MFFQPYNYSLSGQLQNNLIASPIHAQMSSYVAARTQNVIQTHASGLGRLMRLTEKARLLTQQRLAADPNYTLGRGIGVKLAWEYEKLDFQLGGRGSEKWMSSHKEEILHEGKVVGAEGHHRQNVADHPVEQSNPNNIKFYKNKEDHLNQGHGGDFHNESDMPMVDRPKIVTKTRNKTIVKNELKGAGIAAIIGFGTAASMSMIIELSKNGVSYESLKEASKLAIQNGAMGAGFGAFSYAIYRGVEVAVDSVISKYAISLSEKGLKGVKGGIAGGLIILGSSTYSYIQMRNEGYSVQDSILETGKQATFPVATLAASLYFGGPIGAGIGAVSTLGYMGYSLLVDYLDKKFMEELLIFQLEFFYNKMCGKPQGDN